MKVTLPSRVPLTWVFSFVVPFLCILLVEGTSFWLSLTACAIILIGAVAFNVAGGLQYPSGAYVCFNTLFCSVVGMVAKVLLGEPLQTNLIDAQHTLSVYLVGMCSMLAAVLLNSRLRRSKPWLSDTLNGTQINSIAVGCFMLFLLPRYILPGQWVSTYTQFNYFHFLAIMLPVYQLARDTDGRRTFNWISFSVWLFTLVTTGIFAFSKEGMFTGTAAWGIAAVAGGYRLNLKQGVILAFTVVTSLAILTPFAQVGRVNRGEQDVAGIALHLLTHPLETRALYQDSQSGDIMSPLEGGTYRWFDKPQGLVDRLTIVPVDDVLMYVTDHGQPGSMAILGSYFTNVIPRYLYPDKPFFLVGNLYGQAIGVLAASDDSTGVSFSAYADGYHIARWRGVTVILAPLFFLLFYIADSLVGSIRQTRWGLLYLLYFVHQSAEGLINALIYGAGTFSLAVIAAQAVTTRMGPMLGAMALRHGRRQVTRV